ncbi:MAG: helix-turn-helix domain-containing protein [Candidatus Methanoperedenaceae archaeon]|nr:helix-turn-helix domain-containing protein [Candidatus Methanoperedenaceae archaeon]
MTQIDNKVFKAMGSSTRMNMLQVLAENEMHISGLAKELNISVPVAAKHVRILEDAGLIERKEFGRTHILKLKTKNIYNILDKFTKVEEIEMPKGSSLLDALRSVSAVEVKKVGNREFVISTDGEEGLYLYEIDGRPSEKTVDEYLLEEDVTVEWKKLTPVTRKRISIKIKE